MKASRRSVNYRRGAGGSHCASCRYYFSKYGTGHCDKVEDSINSWGLCDLYDVSRRLFGSDPRQEFEDD